MENHGDSILNAHSTVSKETRDKTQDVSASNTEDDGLTAVKREIDTTPTAIDRERREKMEKVIRCLQQSSEFDFKYIPLFGYSDHPSRATADRAIDDRTYYRKSWLTVFHEDHAYLQDHENILTTMATSLDSAKEMLTKFGLDPTDDAEIVTDYQPDPDFRTGGNLASRVHRMATKWIKNRDRTKDWPAGKEMTDWPGFFPSVDTSTATGEEVVGED